jgi:uncharacterized protein (TIGR02996 family)
MNQEQAFLEAMLEQPRDLALRLIFADWLEDQDDPRGELLRLSHLLTQDTDQPNRRQLEQRLQSLLGAGVQPVGPFWTNAVGMQFAWVPPGVFLMGSPRTEQDRGEDETQQRVRLTEGLWVGVHPVTQAQWQAVMGTTRGYLQGEGFPADGLSWQDCLEFCAALYRRHGRRYDVPTEAQWEYACRAGTTTPFHFGAILNGTQANCCGEYPYGTSKKGPSLERPTPVGSYPPNAWGLYDTHGNVWEWCRDYLLVVESPYEEVADPVTPLAAAGGRRALRGGSWFNSARTCRAAMRHYTGDGGHVTRLGCRVCFPPD